MIEFPGCKINLGLNITRKLPNGYHAIESIFVPVSLSDVLEVIAIETQNQSVFTYSGIPIPGAPGNNIVKKAYDLLSENFTLSPVRVHLHKIVPMGAGLGGGSADASAMLLMLNKLFNLKISTKDMLLLAGQLGADCPFFIKNKPAFVTGTGEKIAEINPGLSGKKIVIIYPNISINTTEAFKHIIPQNPEINLKYLVKHDPVSAWKNRVKNDFEKYVFDMYPEIAQIKSVLYKTGAIYASLSGSGSVVYGIFNDGDTHLPEVFKRYFTYISKL